jgi:AraC family transcriptional regulator
MNRSKVLAMAISARSLASGSGWSVCDVVCDHGPRDRAFVEEHAETTIAAVMQGSFQYRTRAGSAVLVPGALLLGNAGSCFECGHEHGQGDRCLAFHFTPAFVESIAAGAPGVRKTKFNCASVPPASALIGLFAEAEVARDARETAALEELATRLAGAVLTITADRATLARTPSVRDERRITMAVRRIEAQVDRHLGLYALAQEAAMSPYHFLRTFRQVTGMTPHQYVLHARLLRAARRLRASADPVSTIAFSAGFNDLATFNRRFRRFIGVTPSVFRTQ